MVARGCPTANVRSVPELATQATREILGCTRAGETQAVAGILCEMYHRRGKIRAVGYDYCRDALEDEAVLRLCNELSEWDVPTRL